MFYTANVKVQIEDEKTGKMKKHTEKYLVDAVSVTDVEVIVTQEYRGSTFDWEITSVSETKIIKVLEGVDPSQKGRA